jgi:hypothetical protein
MRKVLVPAGIFTVACASAAAGKRSQPREANMIIIAIVGAPDRASTAGRETR